MSRNADFVWYEYLAEDVEAAAAFYAKVVGWKASDSGMPGHAYTILSVGDRPIGGMMALTPELKAMGVPPCWTGYVGVDDVDAAVASLVAAGGSPRGPAKDIPDVGRLAVVADPTGAAYILFSPSNPPPPQPRLPEGTPGTIGWHELHAGDMETAFAFYAGAYGWTKDTDMPMGDLGAYRIFRIGDRQAGGMMTKVPQTPMPFWLYYFVVDALGAAQARAEAEGARTVHGPMEVPGGSWIVQMIDPQGGFFAMVSRNR